MQVADQLPLNTGATVYRKANAVRREDQRRGRSNSEGTVAGLWETELARSSAQRSASTVTFHTLWNHGARAALQVQ
jgi:hypothetical protein